MRSYLGRARYSKIDQPPLNPPGATIHRPAQESCGHFASTFRHCHRNQSSPVAPSCTVFGVLFRRAGSFLPARPGIAPSSLIADFTSSIEGDVLFVRPSTLDMDISDGQCVRGMGGSATSAKSAAEGEAAVQTSAHANEQARVLDIPEFVSMGMSTQEQTHLRARTRRTAGSSSESSPSSSSTVSPAQSPRDRSTRESPREQMQGVEAAASAGAPAQWEASRLGMTYMRSSPLRAMPCIPPRPAKMTIDCLYRNG